MSLDRPPFLQLSISPQELDKIHELFDKQGVYRPVPAVTSIKVQGVDKDYYRYPKGHYLPDGTTQAMLLISPQVTTLGPVGLDEITPLNQALDRNKDYTPTTTVLASTRPDRAQLAVIFGKESISRQGKFRPFGHILHLNSGVRDEDSNFLPGITRLPLTVFSNVVRHSGAYQSPDTVNFFKKDRSDSLGIRAVAGMIIKQEG